MKTTVIIGTYNNEAHIDRTVRSITGQTARDWNCIIVDNGSTDGTCERTEQIVKGDPRFRLFRKKNEGPGAGRNFGHRQICEPCTYVHFLDGDDVLHRDFIKVMTAYLEDHPRVGLLGCQYSTIDENGRFVGPETRSRYAPGFLGFPRRLRPRERNTPFEAFFSATGQGPFAVFRNEIFKKTTGYEEGFWSHEDSDIFCQMALLSEVHYLPNRLYFKRVHSSNLTNSPKADYGKFRRKWDVMKTSCAFGDKRIANALAYYYGKHVPLRNFKISLLALREFLKEPGLRRLQWSMTCLGKGIIGLLFARRP